ncbi:Uu.00g000670.m01.CDS01 [Anthostomella pinea]|uniref:Uu.00g000670.m01.CDS01 n=1 Tax=Anthostomella pinea TaxID=933095 RepID=A0AAI8VJB3_9PEZI|nr:Uu.00g000670.m01.CDS01 [Anthostomella pinea]
MSLSWRLGGPARGRGNNHHAGRQRGRGGRGASRHQEINRPVVYELPGHEQYFDWKRSIRRGVTSPDCLDQGTCLQLWQEALAVLNIDSQEFQQNLARDLVDDDFLGLESVIMTATVCTKSSDTDKVLRTVKPFLQVITHPALLDCISVDSFVGTIYRVLGGKADGEQAIALFRSIARKLAAHAASDTATTASPVSEMLSLTLKAMYEFLARQPKARLHDDITSVVESMDGLADPIAPSCPGAESHSIKAQIDVVRRKIAMATSRLVREESAGDVALPYRVRSAFPKEMTMPGGRHDNDVADIAQIQILPTYLEIMSYEEEYLPSTDLLQPHFLQDPVQRHIDASFRLLRHDIFGSVKDVLSELLSHDGSQHEPRALAKNDMRAHTYSQASIQHIFISEKRGLEAIVSFVAPQQARKSKAEQRRWWTESSRLEEGSLVCFVSANARTKIILFVEVVVKSTEDARGGKPTSSLAFEKSSPSITVKVATSNRDNLNLLTRIHGEKTHGVLVDFHNLIPATFDPILRNLQQMMGEGQVRFQQWILPKANSTAVEYASIPPPMYARRPGFAFNLGSITNNGYRVALKPSDWTGSTQILEAHTTLDRGQCHGLLAALSREYALIQGPPGTGKSYVGVQLVRVLLDNKDKARLGPILIICYTNHALDQFLMHLKEVGVSRLIRIGGRSATPELEGNNLRVVNKDGGKTRVESQILGKSYGALEHCMKTAGNTLKPLHQLRKGPSWSILATYLLRKSSNIHRPLEPEDDEGWETVGGDPLMRWLGNRPIELPAEKGLRQDVDIAALTRRAEQDVHGLTREERWNLADHWLIEMRTDVIGITTTALARNIEMLRHVRSRVVICEEAAEVLEPHIMSALMPGVEHMIQIGDHRQLRPQINNYSLSMESGSGVAWQLDRSQFERRAVGEPGLSPAPVAQLNVQRRMRPEISKLIRSVYPMLEDHESVKTLPGVVGMRHNLFWLDHDHVEDVRDDGSRVRSHSNQWEVDMATGLGRHLVRQGHYSATDIALLTPYTGQLQKLRRSLAKDFEIFLSDRDLDTLAADGFEDSGNGLLSPNTLSPAPRTLQKKQLIQTLRLATVDNFQGEEAKVFIVSLVRSNPARKVGFLRTENRINVLLSRAQHGMYLIGNSETYLHVKMWADVHGKLAYADPVGNSTAQKEAATCNATGGSIPAVIDARPCAILT